MKLLESFASALGSVRANKMRAAFTMFGIVVGIAAVIMITSVGAGFTNTIEQQFADMGLDEFQISHTGLVQWHERMDIRDAEFLRNYHGVMAVSVLHTMTIMNAVDQLGTVDRRGVQLRGTDQYAQRLGGSDLAYGRHLTAIEVENATHVAVIDEIFSNRVFGTPDGVGRTLTIHTNWGPQSFTIVGIYQAEEAMEFLEMFEMPFEMSVPITVTQRLANIGDLIGQMRVRVYDRDLINPMADDIIRIMEIRKGAEGIFQMFSIAAALSEVNAVVTLFTMFLTLVASISLLVGGIGVMNIMLVSVTERTREIGIRKSLGATNRNIKFQFLLEAAFLTVLGGVIGIILGALGGMAIGNVAQNLLNLELTPIVSGATVGIIVLVSAVIGLLFGVYPAGKAAKLDPIESLRFE